MRASWTSSSLKPYVGYPKQNHGTPGDAEEKHFPDFSSSLKSAAVRPYDELEQGRDQALDKGAPADEEEPSHDEDPADVEESDDAIDDQMGRIKETVRGEYAPTTYMLYPVQGSFWSPPAPKLLTNSGKHRDTGEPFCYRLRELLPTGGKTGPMRRLLCMRSFG
ncbi:hypothetical protein E4U32_003670 [Claviceps aff. humidiphila group G2b]|nr:hypothetical protein E4U32_003670 [Claviceps aff. humidiphila group G2b]